MRRSHFCRRDDFDPAELRYCSISSSEGKTQANTSTYNIDKRIASGADSVNVSADNSTVTVTDRGAVNAAFGFASDAFKQAVGAIGDQASQAVSAVQASEQTVADAYVTAKAGEQKVLVGVGIAIVGVVAIAALRGH